jgi:hypothetical protein
MAVEGIGRTRISFWDAVLRVGENFNRLLDILRFETFHSHAGVSLRLLLSSAQVTVLVGAEKIALDGVDLRRLLASC